jgi:hypothetical protein
MHFLRKPSRLTLQSLLVRTKRAGRHFVLRIGPDGKSTTRAHQADGPQLNALGNCLKGVTDANTVRRLREN